MNSHQIVIWNFIRIFAVLFLLTLTAGLTDAEVTDPGWILGTADPVSPEDAKAYYESLQVADDSGSGATLVPQAVVIPQAMAAGSATEATPEIVELARALQNDPKLIYEFVHNNIDYVPYYGSLKGATLTLLERSGNDFDQASLMIALLSVNNTPAQYVYGKMYIPNYGAADNYDMKNWLGIDANINIINAVLASGGIPFSFISSTTYMDRVWVKATINGTDYLFDPAFKIYEETTGINVGAAMGYDRNTLLSAAGGTVGADYVQNLNDSGLRSQLSGYSSALIAALRSSYPNASMEEIIGGRKITPEILDQYSTTLRFAYTVDYYWDTIPSTYEHTIRVQHGGIDQTFATTEIAGKKLAITYDTGGGAAVAASFNITAIETVEPEVLVADQQAIGTLQIEQATAPSTSTATFVAAATGTVDLGRVNSTGTVDWTFTITNPSTSPTLTVVSTLTNNTSGAYSFLSGGDTQSVAPGQTLEIVIRFSGAGQSRGTKTATFNADYSYSGTPAGSDTYDLTGFVAADSDLTGSYNFNAGQAYLNNPVDGTAIFKNSGTYTLTINSIFLTGTDQARFQILSGNGAGTLSSGQARNIGVRYLADVVGIHSAKIQVDFTYDGINYTGTTLSLAGETLDNPPAQLWLDDQLIIQEATPSGDTDLIITVDHPYAGDGGTYADVIDPPPYNLKRGFSYVIISDFGGSKDGLLLKKRQRVLDDYRASGLADTSREVLTESLNVMGQTWMRQTNLSDNLLAELSDVIDIRHHRFGLMAQETGYYVDVKTQFKSLISRHNTTADASSVFKAGSFLGSALEHGVLEQLQGVDRPAASTIKLIYLANSQGDKVFRADSVNYLSSIKPQLSGYSQNDLNNFQNQVNNGSVLVLPADGQITLGEWRGKGYVDYNESVSGPSSIGMIIGGDYYGGFSSVQDYLLPGAIIQDYNNEQTNWGEIVKTVSSEPVDLVAGAYLFDHGDLALGGAEPNGLHFSRSYNSDNHRQKGVLGYGWTHNYDISANLHSDVGIGLGLRQPVDAAMLLVSSFVTLDLMSPSDPTAKEWVTGALTAKWAMDQLFENAVTIQLQSKGLTYILLPDGTYSSPPGVTTNLVKPGGLYQLQERFETVINFDSNNKISSWTDIDGNTMSFTYNGDKLQTVTDNYSRTLTLSYTGELLNSVTDSTGRSVSYGYTNEELTTYTDPESKNWGYAYDDPSHPHRMTSLTNPLTVTMATNTYDTLANVKTQTYPRQGGGTVTFNYYFSDFRNMEEDSDGYQTVYHFDRRGRTVAVENTLGFKQTSEYDGQNHVIKSTDARGNITTFTYDGNNNLTNIINALTQESVNVYDGQYRLTDTIDPLDHGSHFEYDTEHHLTVSQGGVTYNASNQPLDTGLYQTGATYYPNGQTESTIDGRAFVATYAYDSFGNPDWSKVGTHPSIDYGYNAVGQMESLKDQVSSTTSFIYNDRGLLEESTDPLLRKTNPEYDDAGRLDYITDRNNDIVDFSYTPTGKIETITYPDASTVSFNYDTAWENILSMVDPLGATGYAYDAINRLISQTDPNFFTVGYTYDTVVTQNDQAGNLTKITYPGNKDVIYTYDALNRLNTVTIDWLSQTTTYNYDNAGRLDWIDNFNGTITDYGYDDANRLTSLINKKSDDTIISSYQFPILDGNGNRVQEIREEPIPPSDLETDNVSFTYNAQRNRLQSVGSDTFAYDNEGQLSSKSGTGYTFDYAHRLIGIGGTDQFFYDGVGNRLKTTRSGTTTKYIYDAAGNLLAEADNANNITAYYIHGMGLLAMVTPSNAVYTYHYDATGNTIAMTDQAETMVNMYAYTPYGRIVNQQETIAQPFKFVGQYGVMTEPNGFYYMRARYYDPEVARFISQDPAGFGGGDVNLYAYVGGNPIRFIDPLGLYSLQQGLKDTASAAWIGAAAAHYTYTPQGELTALVFAGIGVTATIADVYLYSKDPFWDGMKEAFKLGTPIKDPFADKMKDEAIDAVYDHVKKRDEIKNISGAPAPSNRGKRF